MHLHHWTAAEAIAKVQRVWPPGTFPSRGAQCFCLTRLAADVRMAVSTGPGCYSPPWRHANQPGGPTVFPKLQLTAVLVRSFVPARGKAGSPGADPACDAPAQRSGARPALSGLAAADCSTKWLQGLAGLPSDIDWRAQKCLPGRVSSDPDRRRLSQFLAGRNGACPAPAYSH
jgi:hypothetical protein